MRIPIDRASDIDAYIRLVRNAEGLRQAARPLCN
ncbi:hypothetical protein FHT11_003850 [Xanthomonas arboricola]